MAEAEPREPAGPASPSSLDGGIRAEISGGMTGAVIRHVRNLGGDRAVDELLRHAGERRAPAALEDEATWSTRAEAIALFEAAATVTGDDDVARSVGEETLRHYVNTGVAAAVRALGSPNEVLRNVGRVSSKFSLITDFEALDIQDDHAIVAAWPKAGHHRHPTLCRYAVGLLSQVTLLFGMPTATVTERECAARGGRRCLYEVAWGTPAHGDGGRSNTDRAERLQLQLAAATARVNALYTVAADLVSADSASSVLARLTSSAGSAVHASGHVLAVRLPPAGAIEVHHQGLGEREAMEAAAALLHRAPTDFPPSWLVADVATTKRIYGRLAAICPEGSRFLPAEMRLFEVYARFAAAVLDNATALETVKERDATARALLQLAGALSELGTRAEIAERLTATVPAVVGFDQAAVLEWDGDAEVLRGVTSHGLSDELAEAIRRLVIHRTDTPFVDKMLSDPKPTVLERREVDPFLELLFDEMGFHRMAVVPLTAHGTFLGVLAAGASDGNVPDYGDEQLVERLTGLASQGAIAFSNAVLLEDARHQALHDELTGLANRRLLEEATDRAIATAARTGDNAALLFIDLDAFKAINDEHGHAVGDRLLSQVARRLEGTVRSEDTVARVSGDEFAILLPRVTARRQAETVVEKVRAALGEPLLVGDVPLQVSASIGIALAPLDAASYRELLHHADTAMYQTKWAQRRGHVVVLDGAGDADGDVVDLDDAPELSDAAGTTDGQATPS